MNTFTEGQRVQITRGNFKGETGSVFMVLGSQYIIKFDAKLTTDTGNYKATALKAI